MRAMQCDGWPLFCHCSLCCCHHCCSQVYDLAATSAASSGCAAYTIVATAATTPDTIASTIGECCFFCPLLLPPVTVAHPVIANLLIILGHAFPWLGPGRPCPPLAPSHHVCLTLRECVRDVMRTQVHDVTHTQVQGVTCKSMTSPRVCIHPWCQWSRVRAWVMCCSLAQGVISVRCLTLGVPRPIIARQCA